MVDWNLSVFTIILMFLKQMMITSDSDCKLFVNSTTGFYKDRDSVVIVKNVHKSA